MKKIFAVLLASVLLVMGAVTFTSCNNDLEQEEVYKPYANAYETVKAPTGKEKTLKVAMSPDFAPMEFVYVSGATQEVVGFDVLLANYLAKELDMNVEIKKMSFDACQTAVQTGNVDIAISGFSWTEERAENYEITNWYVAGDNETEQVIITSKANEGKYTKAEDFKDLKIGFQGASLQEVLVKETFTDIVTSVDEQFKPFIDLGTATEALKTGKIDALAVAKGNGDSIIANAEESIALSGFEFEVAELYKNNVCLIKKGDTELLEKVNAALDKALENDYYTYWYEVSEILAGSANIDELGYDENGEKITEGADAE